MNTNKDTIENVQAGASLALGITSLVIVWTLAGAGDIVMHSHA